MNDYKKALADLVDVLSKMEKCRLCIHVEEAADECHSAAYKKAFEAAVKLITKSPN
jgi:hypothetical protein